MTEAPQNHNNDTVTSSELIAQAYEAISRLGEQDKPAAPVGSPVPLQDMSGKAPATAEKKPHYSSAPLGSPSTASKSPKQSTAPYQKHQQATRAPGEPAPKLTGRQYSNPPPPQAKKTPAAQPSTSYGMPDTPISQPIRPSKETVSTAANNQQTGAPGSRENKPTQSTQPKQKQSGCVTMIIWIIIIVLIFTLLPNLRLFD